METSVKNIKSRGSQNEKFFFANAAARTLLENHVKILESPDSNWTIVKQNTSRTVYKGQIDGVGIFLKHFHEKSFWHKVYRKFGLSRARSEMFFSQYLSQNGVRTPNPLIWGSKDKLHWFATESALPCTPADQLHNELICQGKVKQIELISINLAKIIAHMHNVGVIHNDLHSGNILVKDTHNLILTDLHRIKRRRKLSRKQRAANLAQLMHDRLDNTTRTQRVRFLKNYLRFSDIGGSLRGWVYLISFFAERHRLSQFAQRDRRILKSNSYFTRIKLPNKWSARVILSSKHCPPQSVAANCVFSKEQWETVLKEPEKLLEGDGIEIIKSSPSGRVIRRIINIGGKNIDVYIKNPRRKKKWKILIDCFRKSRPSAAFIAGHQLLTRGITTALPIASLERTVGPFILDSILITESIDASQLNQFLNKHIAGKIDKRIAELPPKQHQELAQKCLANLGKMVRRLHDVNFAHRDLKSVNILVPWQQGTDPQIVLIDLDGIKQVRKITHQRRFQGLMRLNVSLLEIPEISHPGRLRMLLGYLRHPGSGRINFKPYWYILQDWSAKKLQQQIRTGRKKQKAHRESAR